MTDQTRGLSGANADNARQETQFDPQNDSIQAQQSGAERGGSLEPNDSRNVTGASGGGGVGSPGGSDQQEGGERWGGAQGGAGGQAQGEQVDFEADPALESTGEEVEFDPAADLSEGQQSQSQGQQRQYGERASGENLGSDQMSQFDNSSGGQMGGGDTASRIREHMEVIGADGVHLGTVDAVEGDRIKLTKSDSGMGGHQGHHHYISCGLIAGIEGDKVRLSATAANAYGMEEEE
jgi:hypothetical protein